MSITLEVENDKNQLIKYEGFTDISVIKSMEALCGQFSFTATADDKFIFPVKVGQKCKIFVNNTQVMNGFIEVVEPSYDAASHSINVQGRDRTCDIVDSSLKSALNLNAKITLKTVIEKVLKNLGITDIEVIDNVGTIKPFNTSEKVAAEQGENAFSFIDSYCRKRQVLCTTNADGNISLERASTIRIPTALINVKNGLNNNIKAGSCTYNNTNRFHTVQIRSQESPSEFNFSNENLTDILASETDKEIRNTRSITIYAESSIDIATAKERAKWEVNIRRARAFNYSNTIEGYSYNQNGDIWVPNRLVSVQDDDCGINAILLIKEVNYSLNVSNGSQTNFVITKQDAYTLQAEETERQSKRNVEGDNFLKSLGV